MKHLPFILMFIAFLLSQHSIHQYKVKADLQKSTIMGLLDIVATNSSTIDYVKEAVMAERERYLLCDQFVSQCIEELKECRQ